jgi:hypothetical protein
MTLENGRASQGALNGALPGVPVIIEVEPKDIGVVEAPSPGNGWQKLVLRSRRNMNAVVTIRWRVL